MHEFRSGFGPQREQPAELLSGMLFTIAQVDRQMNRFCGHKIISLKL